MHSLDLESTAGGKKVASFGSSVRAREPFARALAYPTRETQSLDLEIESIGEEKVGSSSSSIHTCEPSQNASLPCPPLHAGCTRGERRSTPTPTAWGQKH